MKKKILAVLAVILVITGFYVTNKKKNDYMSKLSDIPKEVDAKDLPVKVEDIEYKLCQAKNDKDEILMFVQAKNNSTKNLSYFGLHTDDGELKRSILYERAIKAGEKNTIDLLREI